MTNCSLSALLSTKKLQSIVEAECRLNVPMPLCNTITCELVKGDMCRRLASIV